GLRIGTELENVFADRAKTVLFIERSRPRIKFPNAEPHYVVTVRLRDRKAFIQKALPDAFPQKPLVRIKPRKLYRPFRRDANFRGSHDQLCITRSLVLIFRDQKNITFVRKLRAYLLDRKSTRLNSSHVKISYAVFCLK